MSKTIPTPTSVRWATATAVVVLDQDGIRLTDLAGSMKPEELDELLVLVKAVKRFQKDHELAPKPRPAWNPHLHVGISTQVDKFFDRVRGGFTPGGKHGGLL